MAYRPILEVLLKYDFKTLADLYRKKQLTPALRKSIEKDLREKSEHANQRHFKLKDGTVLDLIALKQEVFDNDRLHLVKLTLNPVKRKFECQ